MENKFNLKKRPVKNQITPSGMMPQLRDLNEKQISASISFHH